MKQHKHIQIYVRDTQIKFLKISHPKNNFSFCNNLKYIKMGIMTPIRTKNRLLLSSAVMF